MEFYNFLKFSPSKSRKEERGSWVTGSWLSQHKRQWGWGGQSQDGACLWETGRAYGRRGAAAPPHRRVLAQHQGGDVEAPGWVYQFTSETCVQWLPRFLLRAPSFSAAASGAEPSSPSAAP